MNEQDLGNEPTTTHAEWGAGDPHLLISRGDQERLVFNITVDEVTIGSAPGSTLVLPDTDTLHATVVHDDRDEYVLTLHGAGEMNATSPEGAGERKQILRTGSRFRIGDWTLVFGRQEYADHGRPFGGREGGELSDQPSQPQRPDYGEQRESVERGESAQTAPAQDTSGRDDSRDEEVRDG